MSFDYFLYPFTNNYSIRLFFHHFVILLVNYLCYFSFTEKDCHVWLPSYCCGRHHRYTSADTQGMKLFQRLFPVDKSVLHRRFRHVYSIL